MAIETDSELVAAEEATQAEEQSESLEDETSQESDLDEEESEQGSEDEEEEESEDDSEDEESDEEEDDEEEEEEKPKKRKSGFRRRIDKLNKRAMEAQHEAEYWKKEALKNASKQEQSPKEEAPEQKFRFDEPAPDEDNFDTYEDYLDARSEWKFRELKAKENFEAKKTQANNAIVETLQNYTKAVAEYKNSVEDYDEVVAEVNDIIVNPHLEMEILNSKNGPELSYALAKNRSEFEKINKLQGAELIRAIGRFEAKYLDESQSSSKKPIVKSKAPKPVSKIGTKGKGSKKSIYDPDLSQREFERLRAEQEKQRRAY